EAPWSLEERDDLEFGVDGSRLGEDVGSTQEWTWPRWTLWETPARLLILCRHSATGAIRLVALHGVTADIHSCAKCQSRRTRTPCPATTSGSRTATWCYGPCERTTYHRPWSGTTTPRSSTTCRARRNRCSRLRTWAVCTAVWPGPPTSS